MPISDIPRLTALGQELDTSSECFGELQSSRDILGDAAALRARMQEEGYLYLPGYLEREEALAARRVMLERLAAAGWVDPAYPLEEGVYNQSGEVGPRPDIVKGNAPLHKLLYSGRMIEFYTHFLDGEVTHFDFTWTRAMPPGRSSSPHCDIVYMGRGTINLYTSWTPLGDTPIELGGLMILERSHLNERLRNTYGRKDVDEYCTNRRKAAPQGDGGGGNIAEGGWLSKNPFKLREHLGGRWLSANFSAGDVLIFTMYTVHGSLDNHSDRIRLSSDSRYQLASEPIDERWMGEDPIRRRNAYKRGRIC
jgi:hypothetical protein